MKQLRFLPLAKEDGLREFQRRGWVLVDATYEPVDKGFTRSGRDKVIERDYPLLHKELEGLTHDHSLPLVLIKKNICKVLEPKLVQNGFTVLNRGKGVPFPSTGRQKEFHQQFSAILEAATLTGGQL
jgi:hypothetical protein